MGQLLYTLDHEWDYGNSEGVCSVSLCIMYLFVYIHVYAPLKSENTMCVDFYCV